MAGLYIHIPFCSQACHYCNFHFSTSLRLKDQLLESLKTEITLGNDFLKEKNLSSIYFGGGTPSLLTPDEISSILEQLSKYFSWDMRSEITLETNPENISQEYLSQLKSIGINRLSIGIQSFSDKDLKWMNRAHDAITARRSLHTVIDAGFQNITADLIFGLPQMSLGGWEDNLEELAKFNIPHWSCYQLTIEPKTALHHFIKSKKQPKPDDDAVTAQFEFLMEFAEARGYDHYEISNYCRPGFEAVHNTNYWKGIPYLGIGPSAHSYDGHTRRWNIANNAKYIQSIQKGVFPSEVEELTNTDKYNEYVMVSLRTKWGVDLKKLESFGEKYFNHFKEQLDYCFEMEWVLSDNQHLKLSKKGKLLADHVAMRFFHTE